MRRPRPSYKKLYESLLKGITTGEGYEKYTNSQPTHQITIYDTVEWVFSIKTKNDEEAEKFDPCADNVEIVGLKKSMYASGEQREVRKLN